MKIFIIILLIYAGVTAQTAPSIHSIQGIESLGLQAGSSGDRVGSFLILNPAPASFRLNVNFSNGCRLKRFGGSSYVEIKSIDIQTTDGVDLMVPWIRAGSDCGSFSIDFAKPAGAASYEIEILGSWDALGANAIAGRFWESAVLTITNIVY